MPEFCVHVHIQATDPESIEMVLKFLKARDVERAQTVVDGAAATLNTAADDLNAASK